ncbi:MAG: hypothetical protein K2P17_03870 [Helicobacteraceae bacterium]|nr:hypothetical protein [Helicobacteraceae bacterium]
MKIAKKNWMQIHTYLSLFFLPACILYVLTGIGYIFEFRQNSGANIIEIPLNEMPKNGQEKEFILNKLKENNLKIPQNTELKMSKGALNMGNIKYNVSLTKNKNNEPTLRIIDRGIYGILMLMHKSNGKKYDICGFKLSIFDFIAISFSISLMLFYLSGLIVTQFCKKNRKAALNYLLVGFIITGLGVYFSI